MTKAQLFSADFMIAMASFIFVIAFLQIQQDRMLNEVREQRGILLYDSLTSTLDTLLIHTGYPKDWNETTVLSLGLVDSPNVLNRSKVEKLMNLDDSTAKKLLGIRGSEFSFAITYENGSIAASPRVLRPPIAYVARQTDDTSFLSILNVSGFTWDFYWSGGAALPNTARNVYLNGNEITLMKWIVTNRTNYSTIIYEDIHVKEDDLTDGEQDALKGWVNSSGLYIHLQHHERFLRTFGIGNTSKNKADGVVEEEDPIINATKGQTITFQTNSRTFDIPGPPLYPLKDIVNSTTDPLECIVCKWTYVNGTIYYLPDGSFSSGALALSQKGLLGRNYTKGTFPYGTATSVFVANRRAILEGKQVKVTMLLWTTRR